MIIEDASDRFIHLTKYYYIHLDTNQIYTRHGMEYDGLKPVKHTKKLLEKLKPFLPK